MVALSATVKTTLNNNNIFNYVNNKARFPFSSGAKELERVFPQGFSFKQKNPPPVLGNTLLEVAGVVLPLLSSLLILYSREL